VDQITGGTLSVLSKS